MGDGMTWKRILFVGIVMLLVQPAGSPDPYRAPHYAVSGLPVKVQRNGLAMVSLK